MPPGEKLRLLLALRNAAIMRSPEPLRTTLRLSVGRALGDGGVRAWTRIFDEIIPMTGSFP